MVFFIAVKRLFTVMFVASRFSLRTHIYEHGKTVRLTAAKRVRCIIEECGGVFFKAGQILAMRFDILPEAYAFELMHLFDSSHPLPDALLFTVFRKEVGVPIGQAFTLEPRPIAVASFAQVYAGEYRGKKVAVKIQKPGVEKQCRADIILIKFLSYFASSFGIFRAISLDAVISQIESWLEDELDYRREAGNAEVLLAHVERHHETNVRIPAVFKEFTTRRTLVLEYLDGTPVSRLMSIRRGAASASEETYREEERLKVASFLVRDLMRQYFIDGFFHADPHPGNLLLFTDGRIGYLDFGIIGKPALKTEHFLAFIKGTVTLDFQEMITGFMQFGREWLESRFPVLLSEDDTFRSRIDEVLDGVAAKLEDEFIGIVNEWHYRTGNANAPLRSRSSAGAFFRITRAGEKYGIQMPPDVIGFIRSLLIVDMVCLRLSPKFNMIKAAQSFFEEYSPSDIVLLREAHTGETASLASVELPSLAREASGAAKRSNEHAARERELYRRERLLERFSILAERYPDLYTGVAH